MFVCLCAYDNLDARLVDEVEGMYLPLLGSRENKGTKKGRST